MTYPPISRRKFAFQELDNDRNERGTVKVGLEVWPLKKSIRYNGSKEA